MKTYIENERQIKEILGKTYFDRAFKNDYFTVNEPDRTGNWVYITYQSTGIQKRESVYFIHFQIEAGQYIHEPKMGPKKAIFFLTDRIGNKYTLTATGKEGRVRYNKTLGWDPAPGTSFDIKQMTAKLPKIKIDVEKISEVITDDIKGYTIHNVEIPGIAQ